MTSPGSSTFRFTPIAAVVVIGTVLVLALLLKRASPSFPAIPKGGFVGTVSGLSDDRSEQFTLYFERISDAPGLLVVVFKDGWKPQVVPLVWQSPLPGKQSVALDPVTLIEGDQSFTLSGEARANGFGGDVVASSGARGSWSVTPVSAAAIRDDSVKLPAQFNLKAWLRVKARHDELKARIEGLRNGAQEGSDRAVKLERLVRDQVVLRERSRARRDELRLELSKINEQRRKSTEELKDAVNELGTFTRATRTGQAVELARRISRRETKWFLTHWSSASDPSGVEEELAAREQIDLNKLNAAAKKAEETEKLRMTIADEQQRIVDLERALQGRVTAVAPPARDAPGGAPNEAIAPRRDERPSAPAPAEGGRKPWWKQWGDGF